MTDFETRRDALAAHRAALDRKRDEALLGREAARQAEQKLADFDRSAGRRDQAERARLEKALQDAQSRAIPAAR
jgi:hypothetical protein